ncbi:MAG: ketose-bisphosphate aldolase [Oscillospiraceae bacterium]|nr:ketose-bisphosphate aldolase [Oscillospiraceae bacterium]
MLMNMKELLAVANKNGFAVPAFNISDYNMFNGIMEISEEMNAPVIIAIHPDELSHTKPEMVKGIIERIHKSPVPAVVHLDHGSTFEQIMLAIRTGFTSVMIDASHMPLDENIAICKKVVEAAHAVGVSVEGELGTIGNVDSAEGGADSIIYTDVANAVQMINETNIDCLAIAIGTSHGLYPANMKPKLNIERLDELKEALPEIPMVLHGGSGNEDSEIRKSVEHGVGKINISSDIKVAYYNKMREVLQNPKLREPNQIQPPCLEAMKVVARQKIELFKADGKAALY